MLLTLLLALVIAWTPLAQDDPPTDDTVTAEVVDAPAAEQPVALTGTGVMQTQAFTLAGGNYAVAWAAHDPTGRGCFLGSYLWPLADHVIPQLLTNQQVPGGQQFGSQTQAYRVAPGDYYLKITSDCDWAFTIQAQ